MDTKFEPGPLTVSVHQPNFMPWAGFWNKLVNSDMMILMCGVQFDRGDYQHRVKLAGSWLTVPVKSTQHHAYIKDLKMADATAIPRLAKTVRQVVMSKKNKYRERLDPVMMMLENWPPDNRDVAALNIGLICEIVRALYPPALLTPMIDADFTVRDGSKTENLDAMIMDRWPLNWAKPTYLAGHASLDYMSHDSLKFPVETRFQLLSEGISTDSIVQLIAQQEDPLTLVRNCAKWQTKDGVVDSAKANLSPCPSC